MGLYRPHPMQGWTPDFLPKLADDAVKAGLIDEILPIKGADALLLARELARKKGYSPVSPEAPRWPVR